VVFSDDMGENHESGLREIDLPGGPSLRSG
jgi:hypothetical protein